MGRYYPPDASNPPAFNTTSHPLGARAKKPGLLTVRFELPFAVWCQHCDPHAIVGQGVRFNAEKKKVGNYYSTPIWSFRMKHTACGGWWEIRTDPKNSAYVVVEGAKARDYGEGRDPADGDEGGDDAGDMKFLSEAEREKRREDAFAALEGRKEDGVVAKEHGKRIEELYEAGEVWRDPYDINAKMRREFRAKRKGWKKEDKAREKIQEKFSFGYEVADGTEADSVRAKMVDFGTGEVDGVEEAARKPLFTPVKAAMKEVSDKGKLKSEIKAEKSRQSLQHSLVGNTRVSIDPFLSADAKREPKLNLGIKRKRENDAVSESKTSASVTLPPVSKSSTNAPVKKPALPAMLVEYDSD